MYFSLLKYLLLIGFSSMKKILLLLSTLFRVIQLHDILFYFVVMLLFCS